MLLDDLARAVPGFLGLTITVVVAGRPTTLSTSTVRTPAAASLRLPLDAITGAHPGSTITYWSTVPAAFTDLAREARASYELDDTVIVDGHLDGQPDDGTDGPAAASDIDQALGVLLARGHVDPAAELDRRAADKGISTVQAAREILAALDDPGGPPTPPGPR